MTETREIGREEYRRISDQAHDLFGLIHELMNQLGCNDEWADLHDLMKLAGVIAGTASRYAAAAPDPDAPVPYLPAEGLRDLDAAVKAANPHHAIFAIYGDEEPF
jgi:hypothetical protein